MGVCEHSFEACYIKFSTLLCVCKCLKNIPSSTAEPAELFPRHLSLADIQVGLRTGKYVQGKFQLSRDNCYEAYVNVYDRDEQVFI